MPGEALNGSPSGSGPDDGHKDCRLADFWRWNRVMLEHERSFISGVVRGRAFLQPEVYAGLMHDLTDIDWVLATHPKRVETP